MTGFLRPDALEHIQKEAEVGFASAYFNPQTHNIYLTSPDPALPADHIRNIEVCSSKGCICDDDIAPASPLKQLYHDPLFKAALCDILEEDALYPYADELSSVNIHYARHGEELGWHFDNSSFAVTLMIHPASKGGAFEYVRDVRNADAGDMGFAACGDILAGKILRRIAGEQAIYCCSGSAIRCISYVITDNCLRQLAVLAYNNTKGSACLNMR